MDNDLLVAALEAISDESLMLIGQLNRLDAGLPMEVRDTVDTIHSIARHQFDTRPESRQETTRKTLQSWESDA